MCTNTSWATCLSSTTARPYTRRPLTTIIASTACFTASSSEATGHFEINAFSLDLSPCRAHISRGSHHEMQNPAYCVPCMVLARRRAARARGGCAGNRDDLDVDRKLVLQDWRPSHCPGR